MVFFVLCSYALFSLCVFFGELFATVFWLILIGLVVVFDYCFKKCSLYILEIGPFTNVSYENMLLRHGLLFVHRVGILNFKIPIILFL